MTRATYRLAESSTSNRLACLLQRLVGYLLRLGWVTLLLSTGQECVAQPGSPADHFASGVSALKSGDYHAAEADFKAVLKQEPDNLGALGNLGVVYGRMDRPAMAIATYEHALKLAPQEHGLLLNLGLLYFKTERYSQALPLFVGLEAQDAGNWQARELEAACRIYVGQSEKAIQNLEQLKLADPNTGAVLYFLGVAYTRLKQPEKAKAVFAELLSHSTSPAQSQFLLGKALYDGGQFAEAIEAFELALRFDPALSGAHLELARALISERESERALSELHGILQANPRDAEARYLLGAYQVQLDRFQDAMADLRLAESQYPESWALQFYLGKALFRTGETEQAIQRLRRAEQLGGTDPALYYLLSQALRKAGHTQEAQSALAKVKELETASLRKEQVALGTIPKPQ